MRVAEAVDGHSELWVDYLAEPICQTWAGESGSWFGIAPNEAKALAIVPFARHAPAGNGLAGGGRWIRTIGTA